MNIYPTKDGGKVCVVEVSDKEALSLIKSLVNQIQDGPNCGRLESKCDGDATELTIIVNSIKNLTI